MSKHSHPHRNHHNGGRRGASPNPMPMPMRALKGRPSTNRPQAKKELRASVEQGKAAVVSEVFDLKRSLDDELTAVSGAARNATQRAAAFARQAEHSMTRFAQSALASIKENPIPFAITGIGMTCTGVGLTWLLANEAGQLAQRAQSSMAELAHTSSDTVQRLALDAKSRAQRLEATAEEALRSHPLGVGASALALGVAIGWALPGTSREGRWFGDKRDEVVDKTRAMARDVTDKVRAATAS